MSYNYTTLDKGPFWKLVMQSAVDLYACELDPNYEVNMGFWHTYFRPGDGSSFSHPDKPICIVCQGGALLAKSCNAPLEATINLAFSDIPTHYQNKLKALDVLRRGFVLEAVCWYYGVTPDDEYAKAVHEANINNVPITPMRPASQYLPEPFWEQLQELDVPGYVRHDKDRGGYYEWLDDVVTALQELGI